MADLDCYRVALGLNSVEEIVADFVDTIAPTNRGYTFFVDWDKVVANTDRYACELNLMNTVLRAQSVEEAEEVLRALLARYPEVVSVLPILIACRDREMNVLRGLDDAEAVVALRFDADGIAKPGDLDDLVVFCREVGLLKLFAGSHVTDLSDYVLGVEVGMDTNARKNRSGTAMESIVEPLIRRVLREQPQLSVLPQCSAGALAQHNIECPVLGRSMDFVIYNRGVRGRCLNIETNYYSVSGSKPDVITGYIDRQRRLSSSGWRLAVLTDGPAWRTMKEPLRDMVANLDFVMNLDQVRRGLLEAIIRSL